VAVVNRLFEAREPLPANLDCFFVSKDLVERGPEDSTAELKSSVDRHRTEGQVDVRAVVEEQARKPLPEIEKFPVHFYEDGIGPLEAALRMREIIALEHWKGNGVIPSMMS
jgi:hypothetical protein